MNRRDLIAGAAVVGAFAAVGMALVSASCFHNIAGVLEADPTSERGPWCDAITSPPLWEAVYIGGFAAAGALAQLIPMGMGKRWVVCILIAGIALAIPIHMGSLDYTNNPI